MTAPSIVQSAASNLAAWHSSSIRALGLPEHRDEHWWTCRLPGPTVFHAAISLMPAPRGWLAGKRHLSTLREAVRHPEAAYVSVCDSWNDLDLRALGLQRRTIGQWFARPASPPPTGAPTDPTALSIERVDDRAGLLALEQTMAAAFGVALPLPPFSVHAPAVLEDPAMHLRIGRVDGVAVAVGMAYVGTDVVGIYGVGVLPMHRRHGCATAIMRELLAIEPALPTTLQPSAMAEALYLRLGFEPVGEFAHWVG